MRSQARFKLRPLLASVEEAWPEEDLDVLRAEGAQHRLPLDDGRVIRPGVVKVAKYVKAASA